MQELFGRAASRLAGTLALQMRLGMLLKNQHITQISWGGVATGIVLMYADAFMVSRFHAGGRTDAG